MLARAKPRSIGWPKLERLSADGFRRILASALNERVFDVTIAQGEPRIEPDGKLHDDSRKAVADLGNLAHADRYRGAVAGATPSP